MEERKKILLKTLSDDSTLHENDAKSGGRFIKKWALLTILGTGLVFAAIMLMSYRSSPIEPKVEIADTKVDEVIVKLDSPSISTSPVANNYALNASGYVTARRMATVSSESMGKILNILVEEGQKVSKGQVLAVLDNREAAANFQLQSGLVNSISADIREIESKLKIAKKSLTRADSLWKKNMISVAAYDNDLANFEQLGYQLESRKASLEQARGALGLAKKRLDDTSIKAPFDGIITMRNAQPGEIVSPVSTGGGFTRTGICTLVDMTSLETEVDVNENYISRVYLNQSVDIALNAFAGKKYRGKVIAIIPQGNRQSSTIKVRVKFEELDSNIFPDMGVAVSFHERS
jgi:RND family efflux transporter MFP subunit